MPHGNWVNISIQNFQVQICILIQNLLKFVPNDPIDNNPALVYMMPF